MRPKPQITFNYTDQVFDLQLKLSQELCSETNVTLRSDEHRIPEIEDTYRIKISFMEKYFCTAETVEYECSFDIRSSFSVFP